MSACGAPKSGGGSEGSGDSVTLSTINKKERSELKEGGTLRLSATTLPVSWNSYSIDGNGVDANTMSGFYMPVNFDFDEKGVMSANKDFLESYDVKNEGGKQIVTMHLNPNAKWNSGRTIDWTDYEATWKAQNGTDTKFTAATTDGFNLVTSVAKGEKDTDVVITFKSTYPDWSAAFSSVLPKEGVKDPDTYNKGWAMPKTEWGSGPFAFKSYDKAQRVVTFERNPKWWGEKALLDSVTFRELDNPADVQAFANSEIDVVDGLINANSYTTAKKRTDGEVREAQGKQWRHFTFNSKAANLTDVKVRQAIVKGINREAITASDLAGMPVDAAKQQLGNHFFVPGHEKYVDNSTDFKYDPEKAKADLDAAGWKLESGKDVRTKDGKQLTINYAMLTGVPTSENEGKLFQSDMSKIGVKVNLVNTSSDDFTKTLTGHSFDVIAFTWQSTNYPMNNIRQIYGAKAAEGEGAKVPSESNYAQLISPEIEKLTVEADTEADQNKRAEKVNQIDKLIWDEVHTVPLYTRKQYVAIPKNVANYGASTYEFLEPQNIGFVK